MEAVTEGELGGECWKRRPLGAPGTVSSASPALSQHHHLLFLRPRQQLNRAIQQRPTVGGQHERHEHRIEAQDAALDCGDGSFDPILKIELTATWPCAKARCS